jgi:tRNA nucleotidyltransferase (CCA-adding enzyme)
MFDEAQVLAALAAAVPPGVLEVCTVLVRAGHEAVTVGGAVRDAMLGREAGDWDVASSARPEEVVALFEKTIPTGLQHGTVTVVVGKGRARETIEVTTYRGEGAYEDGRRPTSVVFGVPLDEDLARRDLVVNAIAYDPVRGVIHDPFGGREDLAAGRLRAVGDATARFTEDGLRVMRAVRFAATLGFELDPETERAIPAALPSLAKVSRERVKVELDKTLAAPAPGAALEIARRTGVLDQAVPEAVAGLARGSDGMSGSPDDAAWRLRRDWVDAAPRDAVLRAAALLSGLSDGRWTGAGGAREQALGDPAAAAAADACWRRLKGANDERDRVARLVKIAWAGRAPMTEVAVRRLLAGIGRARAADAMALWSARAAAAPGADQAREVAATAAEIVARGDALAAGELAISGAVLMETLGIPPSREIGRLLELALDAVLEDPGVNERERLLELAREARGAS